MKQFSEYCRNLLITHECVVIPDFGALITRKRPAYYSEELEKFFPPSRKLAFNRNIKNDDGLLAHHISVLLNIPFAESRELIKQKVKEIESLLSANNSIDFGSLGRFVLESENNIVFTPSAGLFTNPGFYGFPILTVSELDEYKKREQIKAVITRIPASPLGLVAGIALLIALSFIPLQISRQSLVQQQKAYFQIQNRPFQYHADSRDSVAVLIDEMTQKENALAINSDEQIVKESSAESKVTEPVEKETTPEIKEVAKPEKKETVKLKEITGSGYYLIAGSFVEMWRAEKYIKELEAKGFSPSIINSDDKLRVSVSYSADKNGADNSLSEFRNNHPEMQVWLLKK